MGIFVFIILFLFAPIIAKAIIGDLTGGNTLNDVTYVIRVIATAILVVPILSIYRGYLEGHKFITPTAISQVVEQVARIVVIIAGSYAALNVFSFVFNNCSGCSNFWSNSWSLNRLSIFA